MMLAGNASEEDDGKHVRHLNDESSLGSIKPGCFQTEHRIKHERQTWA